MPPTAPCARDHGWVDWGTPCGGGQVFHGFKVTWIGQRPTEFTYLLPPRKSDFLLGEGGERGPTLTPSIRNSKTEVIL